LLAGEDALERAPRIRNWSRDVVVCSDGPLGLDEEGRNKLSALGIGVREEKIARLEGGDGLLRRIVFEDGSELAREALFFMPPQRQSSELAEILGCEVGQMGPAPCIVKNDPMTKETTVPGVYVAGDAGSSMQQALLAAASGAMAAISINHALIAEEVASEVEATA
jgi:thioredoxin reductase